MKNLNFSKLLFIPLLCAGISASAQSSLVSNHYVAVTANTQAIGPAITVPPAENSLPGQKGYFKNVAAADGSASGFAIGLEPEALLPLGNFKNSVSAGAGINLKALYHLSDAGAVTGTVGYNYFLPKEDVDFKYAGIPVKIGYLAKLGDMFFIEPQVGLYSLRISDDDGNSASDTNLLLAAKIGLNIGEKSHLGFGYNYIKVTGGSYAFAGVSYLFTF
ncbi:hypothetical protein EWM62_13670 [Mucilaginibacter terrigena]|uniref:Outer membrane protein beta-barrel domain-containing protein n=1 Tax=Mucilaginibacter terrigena TaxID=2492395 RepID=A0A4Q5LJ58_9SPHI|nr:hypothetical protein [Mucilaginibacter terrigena]RYU89373.1 hypothetical protein EWM62_13670 [Mucilaginibacter terrigena]